MGEPLLLLVMVPLLVMLLLLSLLEGGPPSLPRPKTTNHDSRTDDVPGGRTEGPAQEEVPVTPPGRPLRAQSISHKRAKAQASPVPQNLMRVPLPKAQAPHARAAQRSHARPVATELRPSSLPSPAATGPGRRAAVHHDGREDLLPKLDLLSAGGVEPQRSSRVLH